MIVVNMPTKALDNINRFYKKGYAMLLHIMYIG